MANLRKKVPASHLTRRRVVAGNGEANHGGGNEMHVDNRPSIPKASENVSSTPFGKSFVRATGVIGGNGWGWQFT